MHNSNCCIILAATMENFHILYSCHTMIKVSRLVWLVDMRIWAVGHFLILTTYLLYAVIAKVINIISCAVGVSWWWVALFYSENVNEYLRLSAMDDSNVDRQQAQRVKAAFEKRNQKSTQTIAQLQRKLEVYTVRLRELDETGVLYPGGSRHTHRQARTVLKDVGQGIRLNVCSFPRLLCWAYHLAWLWSPCGIGLTIIFLPCGFFFFLLQSFFFSSPNLSHRRLDICHTSTHGVALVWI